MKVSEVFRQYIWLVDLIFRSKGISFQEINEQWMKTGMSGGNPMLRQTFIRHKEAIQEMFGINIECQPKGGYLYYIESKSTMRKNDLQTWMLDSLSVSNMLMESASLKDSIVLENIPAGKEFLQPIINAMKRKHKLELTYCKFGQQESYTITVEPYAIKVFKQRWYLLAKNTKRNSPVVYALDRTVSLAETTECFEKPSDFDVDAFFCNFYGVICGSDKPAERIVIRAYYPFVYYLRTLPLHHSQKELVSTPDYADFEYFLHPTFDFRQELLAQGNGMEVLEPATFRQEMKEELQNMLARYR